MIITDRFVFLHLHKSGGTFVNQLLLNCVPGARQIGYHLPYAELPVAYRRLPVLGTVRDPRAYYVSWYFFQRGQRQPNALFRICSEDGSLGFAETVANLVGLHRDAARVDRLVAVFPDRFGKAGLNLTKACIDRIRGCGLGFYSFLYHRLYAGAGAVRIVRVEALRKELREALVALNGEIDARTDAFLSDMPPLNRSAHGAVDSHYDAALAARVAEADGALMDLHGYAR
ncbi:hypothetical protein DAH66_17565 [Sphingomonas koreensis]|uniref:Sulfotransferase family protein n=1 Tax=Sphingomonas koreensis TaxID=93064 RepID=A0A430FZR9_9SPHN|nr:hypothetical protein [Sphingomonas koreensis]RSY79372.1 hypothetical protein DAH66_17565 [Sphingomonas koreensis]